jgi:hypothetical protein
VNELAQLTRILSHGRTTEELPPEDPGVVELSDEVVVELAAGDTERYLAVDPVEAPLDDLRISVESPLAHAVLGRRVGDQVEVDAPDGRFRCHILTTGRYQTAVPSWPGTCPWCGTLQLARALGSSAKAGHAADSARVCPFWSAWRSRARDRVVRYSCPPIALGPRSSRPRSGGRTCCGRRPRRSTPTVSRNWLREVDMPGVALVLATLRLDVADRGGVLGQPGTELVTRISGLLVTAIAVQLVADAIGEFIREGV